MKYGIFQNMEKQPKDKQKRRRITDENQFAKAILDLIIDESEAEPPPTKEKDPLAVQRGQLGGPKGGHARAKKLSAEERSAIARKAARARWDKA
jgi:hypothetical protein